MVSLRARLFLLIMKLMSMKDDGPVDVERKRKNLESRVFLFRKPRDVIVEEISIEGISCEWLIPPNYNEDLVIIYLHGWGSLYCRFSQNSSRVGSSYW